MNQLDGILFDISNGLKRAFIKGRDVFHSPTFELDLLTYKTFMSPLGRTSNQKRG